MLEIKGLYLPMIGGEIATGEVFFVDSGSATGMDAAGYGKTPEKPFVTLDYAFGTYGATANNGDIIVVMPGHAETVTTVITMDKAGTTVLGLGNGTNRPAFTCNAAIDCITVTGANIKLKGLYFAASTLTGCTARINVAASHLTVEDCEFNCGQYDLETFTVAAAGDYLTIKDCSFHVTANGPDAAVEIEAAGVDRFRVEDCFFDGGGDTNAWDVAALNSDAAHTNNLIKNNFFSHGAAIDFDAAATGIIAFNCCGEGTLGSMIDPGSCMCFENYEADAVDESGRLFPTSAAS